jgi:hypothetical protein
MSAHAWGYKVPARPFSFLASRRVSGANPPMYGAQRRELRSVFLLVPYSMA